MTTSRSIAIPQLSSLVEREMTTSLAMVRGMTPSPIHAYSGKMAMTICMHDSTMDPGVNEQELAIKTTGQPYLAVEMVMTY